MVQGQKCYDNIKLTFSTSLLQFIMPMWFHLLSRTQITHAVSVKLWEICMAAPKSKTILSTLCEVIQHNHVETTL